MALNADRAKLEDPKAPGKFKSVSDFPGSEKILGLKKSLLLTHYVSINSPLHSLAAQLVLAPCCDVRASFFLARSNKKGEKYKLKNRNTNKSTKKDFLWLIFISGCRNKQICFVYFVPFKINLLNCYFIFIKFVFPLI